MKEKILVVDDDKSMVNMIKDVLEMEGYAVTTAFDGEQALKQVQKQSDIILLDINLPKMDGIQAVRGSCSGWLFNSFLAEQNIIRCMCSCFNVLESTSGKSAAGF